MASNRIHNPRRERLVAGDLRAERLPLRPDEHPEHHRGEPRHDCRDDEDALGGAAGSLHHLEWVVLLTLV
ncbi:hypothetical protein ACFPRL_18290 [Pseudoclavibacter helvolus]